MLLCYTFYPVFFKHEKTKRRRDYQSAYYSRENNFSEEFISKDNNLLNVVSMLQKHKINIIINN